MAIRQTRIFVDTNESMDGWAETLIGRVIAPTAEQFNQQLQWFWFSRYIADLTDSGDCDLTQIAANFKQPLQANGPPMHRSLRFRFNVADGDQVSFENQILNLINQHGYAISDFRDYDQVADTGGHRFLGIENRLPGRDAQRAALVTLLYQTISQLVIDGLVGPDAAGRYRIETNNDPQNPNGSTFESLHHLFFNITQVPLSVLLSDGAQANLLGTYWGGIRGHQQRTINGQLVNEVFIPY